MIDGSAPKQSTHEYEQSLSTSCNLVRRMLIPGFLVSVHLMVRFLCLCEGLYKKKQKKVSFKKGTHELTGIVPVRNYPEDLWF